MTELDTNDGRFPLEASAWSFYKDSVSLSTKLTVSTFSSQCDIHYLMGGPQSFQEIRQAIGTSHNVYYSRTFTNLPNHAMFFFKANVWQIDADSATHFDGITFYFASNGYEYICSKRPVLTNMCGDASRTDVNMTVIQKWTHSDPSLTLIIYVSSYYFSNTEVFGLRDLSLTFSPIDKGTNSQCLRYDGTLTDQCFTTCICPQGQYKSPSGTCANCHSSCEECYDGTELDCLSCSVKQGKFYDGARCASCDASCGACSGISPNQCVSCRAGYILSNDNRCIDTTQCTPSFNQIASNVICETPCDPNEFLYWHASCQALCGSPSLPWSSLVDFATQQCNSCDRNLMSSWNTLCSSTCNILFTKADNPIVASSTICKGNFSVFLVCNFIVCQAINIDFLKSTDKGFQYIARLIPESCDLQENDVRQNLVTVSNNSQLSFSLKVQKADKNVYILTLTLLDSLIDPCRLDFNLYGMTTTETVPNKFVLSPALEELIPYTSPTSIAITAALAASLGGTLALGATSMLWSLASFQQFVSYLRYLNVTFPPQIDLFFSFIEPRTWDFIPNPLNRLANKYYTELRELNDYNSQDYLPPPSFPNYEDDTSLFLPNGGQMITMGLSLVTILGAVLLLKKIRGLSENRILVYMKVYLRWNTIFRTFLQSIAPLSLAVFLQFRVFSFNHVYTIICGFLAIVSLIYLLIMSWTIIHTLWSRETSHLRLEFVEKQFGTLYEGINLTNAASKYYYIILMFRDILIILLITFAVAMPLLQVSCLVVFNIFIVYYLFKQPLFESKALIFINRANQIFTLMVEVLIFMLCVINRSRLYYEIVAWTIVALIVSVFTLEFFYIILLQLFEIKKVCKKLWGSISKKVSSMKSTTKINVRTRVRGENV